MYKENPVTPPPPPPPPPPPLPLHQHSLLTYWIQVYGFSRKKLGHAFVMRDQDPQILHGNSCVPRDNSKYQLAKTWIGQWYYQGFAKVEMRYIQSPI
jgi:hypothetical protein